jgi:hypothetical protein
VNGDVEALRQIDGRWQQLAEGYRELGSALRTWLAEHNVQAERLVGSKEDRVDVRSVLQAENPKQRVLIVGGGIGGVYTAMTLQKLAPDAKPHIPTLDDPAVFLCTGDCVTGRANMIPTARGFVGEARRFGLRANGVQILQFIAGGFRGNSGSRVG